MYKSKYFQDTKHPCLDCGKPCSAVSLRCAKCARNLQQGKNHPRWNGGKRNNGHGYIQLRIPTHHRAQKNGYVMEHIVAWENYYGKQLPKGWIIHHLNGMPGDNRISNLQALPNKKHYLILQAKAKRIQELEAMLKRQGHLI